MGGGYFFLFYPIIALAFFTQSKFSYVEEKIIHRQKQISCREKIKGHLYFFCLTTGWLLLWVLPVWGQTDAGIIEKSLRKSRPEFQPPPEEVVPDIQIEDSREL